MLESSVGQLARGGRAGRATNGRSPPPTFRPGGSSWSPAGPASSPPSSRDCRRPRPSPRSSVPGLAHHAGQGRVRQPRGRARAQGRFGLATLDGIGAPTRAELAAAGGLLAYLDATQKGAGILLDAPRRVSRSAHMAIDSATRDSLELCRSVSGSVAGSLLGEIDRCQTAAGRRLLASDISAPLTDRRRDRAAARAWSPGCTRTRFAASARVPR